MKKGKFQFAIET